jgi:proline iminopeptidase
LRFIARLTAACMALGAFSASAQPPAKPASRSEAIAIIASARRILTPNGVERTDKVRIGGIEPWVSQLGVLDAYQPP